MAKFDIKRWLICENQALLGRPLPFVKKDSSGYLTFSSTSSFTIHIANGAKNWNGTSMEYSTDALRWNEWDGTTTVASAVHCGEHRIYMRGKGNTSVGGNYQRRFVLSGNNIRCIGNIENLLDHEKVANGKHPSFRSFWGLFNGNTSLIEAPDLPMTEVNGFGFNTMFKGCTNLTKAPSIASIMKWGSGNCYQMFQNCTKLTEVPPLPTVLSMSCFEQMFSGCTSLTKAPELPVTELKYGCYAFMFENCAGLTEISELPAIILADYCYHAMFKGCTGLKLSEKNTAEYSVEYRIPSNDIGTLGKDSLLDMFANTGGTFTGTPSLNTTYYTSNKVVPVYE